MVAESQDYYRLLGVSREAPERQIKKAYYEKARQLHPDKAPDKETADRNASELAKISKAYNVLKDKDKRAAYDASLGNRPAGGTSAPAGGPAPSSPPAARPAPPNKPAGEESAPEVKSDPPTGGGDTSTARPGGSNNAAVLAQRKTMAQKAFVRGMQSYKVADYKAAVGFFKAAAEYDEDSEPQYHLKYAQCLVKARGSFITAMKHAEKACEMDPYKVEYKIALAEIHETVGALSKAKEIYEEVLRWDANNKTAKLQIQLLEERMGPQDKSPLVRKFKTFMKKLQEKKKK